MITDLGHLKTYQREESAKLKDENNWGGGVGDNFNMNDLIIDTLIGYKIGEDINVGGVQMMEKKQKHFDEWWWNGRRNDYLKLLWDTVKYLADMMTKEHKVVKDVLKVDNDRERRTMGVQLDRVGRIFAQTSNTAEQGVALFNKIQLDIDEATRELMKKLTFTTLYDDMEQNMKDFRTVIKDNQKLVMEDDNMGWKKAAKVEKTEAGKITTALKQRMETFEQELEQTRTDVNSDINEWKDKAEKSFENSTILKGNVSDAVDKFGVTKRQFDQMLKNLDRAAMQNAMTLKQGIRTGVSSLRENASEALFRRLTDATTTAEENFAQAL